MNQAGSTIEQGYLVFTFMPSLYCPYNCSHCYLSLEQRRSTYVMPDDHLVCMLSKVRKYYDGKGLPEVTIVVYYYGGEPTSMGLDYFKRTLSIFDEQLPKDAGFSVRHVILSSLIGLDIQKWLPLINDRFDSYIQTSYDGLMRGKNYLKKWEGKVKELVTAGIKVATISVVNEELAKVGGANTYSYLKSLGVSECGWLPFMLNEQNEGEKYARFASNMRSFNDFMIDLSDSYFSLNGDECTLSVGEIEFVKSISNGGAYANTSLQTLFVLPDGTICLPDYREGWKEYFKSFGNLVSAESFDEILSSPERISHMLRQVRKNDNPECMTCPHGKRCLIEFAKPNNPTDECFGGKRFVEYVLDNSPVTNNDNLLF